MDEQFRATPEQAAQSALSMGLSAYNGIMVLAGAMAAQGLLRKDTLDYLHRSMLEPLNNDGGSPEMMALQVRRIDELCATIARVIDDRG